MRKVISEVMNLEEGRISIKATTNEKMGFIGREEGIVSYAVALIKKE
jgi:2-C-methyl-D-erythritol 2,4-cyclodiphosphate synthase